MRLRLLDIGMATNSAAYTRAWKARNAERVRRYSRGGREKVAARDKVWHAIRSGRLIRPECCERCGGAPPLDFAGRAQIEGHHGDYSEPLVVEWLCPSCHVEADREARR